MQTVGRWIWIFFSLMLASSVAVMFLPVAIAVDPVLRKSVYSLQPEDLDGWVLLFLDPAAIAGLAMGAAMFVMAATVAICVVPVTIVALLGEAADARAMAWYVGATGVLAGAMPWIVRAGRSSEQVRDKIVQTVEMRFALIFFLTGIAAGLVYWLAAGRNAGRRDRKG